MPIRKPSPALKRFARRLRDLREARGWTMTYLAKQADLTKQTISFLELAQNEASLTTIAKLAKALGVGPEALFDPSE